MRPAIPVVPLIISVPQLLMENNRRSDINVKVCKYHFIQSEEVRIRESLRPRREIQWERKMKVRKEDSPFRVRTSLVPGGSLRTIDKVV